MGNSLKFRRRPTMPTFEQFLWAEEKRTALLDGLWKRQAINRRIRIWNRLNESAERFRGRATVIGAAAIVLLYIGIVVSCFA